MAIGCTLNLAGEFAMENPVLQFREAAAELGAPIASQALPGQGARPLLTGQFRKTGLLNWRLCAAFYLFSGQND